MSPEQADGERVDHRTDLFSLGSVLYAMCTGRPPFRANTTLAVLRRVSEDTPRPIREVNPEIPEWLEAIIAKLHSKDPADRFQTAAEVADLLGQHLAHLQQPAREPMPPPVAAKLEPRRRKRRMLVLALCLMLAPCCLIPVGWVSLRSTSDEKVAKPQAAPPRVTREPKRAMTGVGVKSIAVPPAVATGPFVILPGPYRRKSRTEVGFATLTEALKDACSYDTIEIRGNGPFVCPHIRIPETLPVEDEAGLRLQASSPRLTIRAASGFRPVLQLNTEGLEADLPLIETKSALVLEGLELHRVTEKPCAEGMPFRYVLLTHDSSPFYVANCRFVLKPNHACIGLGAVAELRNCEFLTRNMGAVSLGRWARNRLTMENCVHTGGNAIWLGQEAPMVEETLINLTHNTFLCSRACTYHLVAKPELPKPGVNPRPIRVTASGNIFDVSDEVLAFAPSGLYTGRKEPLPLAEAQAPLQRLLGWNDWRNLYSVRNQYLLWHLEPDMEKQVRTIKALAEWKRFWKSEDAGSIEGRLVYECGTLNTRSWGDTPERLRAWDFRLRAGSPGHRAAKDGRDLGVDVTILGPGLGYEQWKKTPAYQQWLKTIDR
jgi:hypothetical protein